jgi:hypothetical protein
MLRPSSSPYSPECVEEEFCELRLFVVLGSSPYVESSEVRSIRTIAFGFDKVSLSSC